MKPPDPPKTRGKTALEKMTDLTQRIVTVRKEELPKPRKRKPKKDPAAIEKEKMTGVQATHITPPATEGQPIVGNVPPPETQEY